MQSSLLLAIILAYFALLLGIAFYTSRHSDNDSFFIGNRSSKWWVVAFGMVGTSLSGMTFISVPGTVGLQASDGGPFGGFTYFEVVIGYWLGYFVVAFMLLPLYYRLRLTSIYSYLDQRFGNTSYKTGALFFILSRTLGATLRLYLVIKVLELFVLKVMGISFELSAIVILALILLYTYRGGVKTIVWTDTLQTTFMLLALITCVVYMLHSLDLSFGGAWQQMSEQGLNRLIVTDPASGKFFLKEIIGGAFITIAMTGLDQEMMQKNISVRTLGDSQKNMIVLNFLQAGVVFLFLTLGGLLYLFATKDGAQYASGAQGWQLLWSGSGSVSAHAGGDNLFPSFAIHHAPFFITVCFMIGLISALFPSADGALTALTSSFCIDIIGLKRRPDWDERKQRQVRLIVHNAFALIFLACVFFFRATDNGSLIRTLLIVAGYTYGPLLGLFAFGMLSKRQPGELAVPIICIAAPVVCYLLKSNEARWLGGYVIGTELLPINAALTSAGLLLFSKKEQRPAAVREEA
ncbi:MAG: sodium:solute symporter [Bacteroidetes bacterium]|nr:sodium:solute symporter [Bacteroidota bacterium]